MKKLLFMAFALVLGSVVLHAQSCETNPVYHNGKITYCETVQDKSIKCCWQNPPDAGKGDPAKGAKNNSKVKVKGTKKGAKTSAQKPAPAQSK